MTTSRKRKTDAEDSLEEETSVQEFIADLQNEAENNRTKPATQVLALLRVPGTDFFAAAGYGAHKNKIHALKQLALLSQDESTGVIRSQLDHVRRVKKVFQWLEGKIDEHRYKFILACLDEKENLLTVRFSPIEAITQSLSDCRLGFK